AEPIGSGTLAAKYPLGVGPATVRSVLSELAERGLLEQPHTSAGRIPSDQGYRYYVDRLGEPSAVGEAARETVGEATDGTQALEGTLRETLRALSRLTRGLAVATTRRDADLLVRTAIVSALGPNQALLVLALGNGHVENRMIECPANLTLDEVGQANAALAKAIVGKDLAGVTRLRLGSANGSAGERMLAAIAGHLRSIARELTRGKILAEGEPYIFAQPEFANDGGSLARLFHEIFEGDLLYETLTPPAVSAGGEITIGRENANASLHRFSVVRRAFFAGDREAGVIAVVGPTRMDYDGSGALLDFTAGALSQSLTRFFG
ncbi:heat-inducible transcription repressor HrcA, partial [bacterium]